MWWVWGQRALYLDWVTHTWLVRSQMSPYMVSSLINLVLSVSQRIVILCYQSLCATYTKCVIVLYIYTRSEGCFWIMAKFGWQIVLLTGRGEASWLNLIGCWPARDSFGGIVVWFGCIMAKFDYWTGEGVIWVGYCCHWGLLSLPQTYAKELQKAPNPHHKVIGGFHLNPKGVEMALRVCAVKTLLNFNWNLLKFTELHLKNAELSP